MIAKMRRPRETRTSHSVTSSGPFRRRIGVGSLLTRPIWRRRFRTRLRSRCLQLWWSSGKESGQATLLIANCMYLGMARSPWTAIVWSSGTGRTSGLRSTHVPTKGVRCFSPRRALVTRLGSDGRENSVVQSFTRLRPSKRSSWQTALEVCSHQCSTKDMHAQTRIA